VDLSTGDRARLTDGGGPLTYTLTDIQYDPATDRLYVVSSSSGTIYTIDVPTGARVISSR
jgi:hypothetical protein